jgi:hypothetical protein
MGTKSTLLRTLVAKKGGKSVGIGVPGFIPFWRKGCQSTHIEKLAVLANAPQKPTVLATAEFVAARSAESI